MVFCPGLQFWARQKCRKCSGNLNPYCYFVDFSGRKRKSTKKATNLIRMMKKLSYITPKTYRSDGTERYVIKLIICEENFHPSILLFCDPFLIFWNNTHQLALRPVANKPQRWTDKANDAFLQGSRLVEVSSAVSVVFAKDFKFSWEQQFYTSRLTVHWKV